MTAIPLSVAAPLVMAALLFASGLIKLRAAERAQLGLHLFSLLELLVAFCLGLLAFTGAITPGVGLWSAVAAAALVVGSSVHLGRRLAARKRLREQTEARRLETYVRYLSERDSPGA